MKLRNYLLRLFPLSVLLVASALAVSAQSTMPDPHDVACWTSLSALHSCVLAQQNRVLEQAERCTSYPEYQCMPEENAANPEATKRSEKLDPKAASTGPIDTSEKLTVMGGGSK